VFSYVLCVSASAHVPLLSLRLDYICIVKARLHLISHRSVLGPLLVLLFVNDLPDWIRKSIRMFADDPKIWCVVKDVVDNLLLQKDLDSMAEWSKEWSLRFNPEKCKVMHIGHNVKTQYYMKDNEINRRLMETDEERDLGIFISDLKPSLQCVKAANTAMSVLGIVRRNFKRLDVEGFRIIYKGYIRPHLVYCIQAWSPFLVKDKLVLENVQRKATTLVRG